MNLFSIDHGPDNYEEYIDIDRIVFIRCKAKFNTENQYYANYPKLKEKLSIANPDFDYIADITFDGGFTEKIKFSALGWEDFVKAISKKNKKK